MTTSPQDLPDPDAPVRHTRWGRLRTRLDKGVAKVEDSLPAALVKR